MPRNVIEKLLLGTNDKTLWHITHLNVGPPNYVSWVPTHEVCQLLLGHTPAVGSRG